MVHILSLTLERVLALQLGFAALALHGTWLLVFNSYTLHPPKLPVIRSYPQEYRRSHQNSQLKPVWAGLVLG